MARTSTSRRRFLTGMGAAGVGGASLLSLLARRATAQASPLQNGCSSCTVRTATRRATGYQPAARIPKRARASATTYTLNKGNEAFAAVKDRMTLIDGINVSVNGGDLHSNGQIHVHDRQAGGRPKPRHGAFHRSTPAQWIASSGHASIQVARAHLRHPIRSQRSAPPHHLLRNGFQAETR